jgi:hypothetical protein
LTPCTVITLGSQSRYHQFIAPWVLLWITAIGAICPRSEFALNPTVHFAF